MEYISFDLETTGVNPKEARIVTYAALRMKNGEVLDKAHARLMRSRHD